VVDDIEDFASRRRLCITTLNGLWRAPQIGGSRLRSNFRTLSDRASSDESTRRGSSGVAVDKGKYTS
jgi:hypothetical protein